MLSPHHYHQIIPYFLTFEDSLTLSFVNKKTLHSIQTLNENPCYSVVIANKILNPNASALKRELKLFSGIHCFNCGSRIEQLKEECSRFDKIRHLGGETPCFLEHKVIQTTYVPEKPDSFSQLETVIIAYPSDISRLPLFASLKKVVIFLTDDESISLLYQVIVKMPPTVNIIIHFNSLSLDSIQLLLHTKAHLISRNWREFITYATDNFVFYLSELKGEQYKRIAQFLPKSIEVYSQPTFLIENIECEEQNGFFSLQQFVGVQKASFVGSKSESISIEVPNTIVDLTSNFIITNLNELKNLKTASLNHLPMRLNAPMLRTLKLSYCRTTINVEQCFNLESVQIEKCSSTTIVLSHSIKFLIVEQCSGVSSITLPSSVEKYVINDCCLLVELKNSTTVNAVGITIKNCKQLKNVILNDNKLKTLLYKSDEECIENINELKQKGVVCLDF